MKLYILAGEASGDLHGSNLIKALLRLRPDTQCRIWGGDLMQAAGGVLVKHYRDLAFMGFWEVLKNLRTIIRNIRFCRADILQYAPDALVLIDYPGFNLRIAKWAKRRGIRVIYYISPQIWAWHTSRVQTIKRDVDKMIVILPFETAFYQKFGMEVEYVGHPLLDAIRTSPAGAPETARLSAAAEARPVIAILPGSRQQEVKRMLPILLSAVPFFPNYRFVVAGASTIPESVYRQLLESCPGVELVFGKTYEVLRSATAALVKSGTSTLETALIGVPQVVCYAGNPLSYAIARRLVQVNHISLVNLILDRPLIRELIQQELNTGNLVDALQAMLEPQPSNMVREGYAELRHMLGDGGASDRAAKAIFRFLDSAVPRPEKK